MKTVLMFLLLSTFGSAHAVTYVGRATVLSASVNLLLTSPSVVVGDTGELDPSGTALDASAVKLSLPPPIGIKASTLHATTSGAGGTAVSSAAIQKVAVNVAGLLQVSADVVTADTTAACGSTSGKARIVNLKVNGLLINTEVSPDLTVTIPIPLVGSVTLNEQIKPDANTIMVNAVHVSASALGLAGADVVIGRAVSGVKGC